MKNEQTHDSTSAINDACELRPFFVEAEFGTDKGRVSSEFNINAAGYRTATGLAIDSIEPKFRGSILSIKVSRAD